MNIYDIPCDGDGKKIRVLNSEVTILLVGALFV